MRGAAILAAWMLACGALAAQSQAPPDQGDMHRLLTQAVQWEHSPLNPENPNPWTTSDPARRWAAELQPDGSWKDVDYHDQSRGFWKSATHLKRTLSIAAEAADTGGQPGAALQAAALRAAHYWIAHDFRNPNWWQNEIGVPSDMVRILLFIGDAMSPADKAGALKIVDRATFSMTGQNLVWKSGILFRKALVEDDPALALKARDIILAELKITTQEGLQADWSFQQHGAQQQMGNYGLSFAGDLAAWAVIWRGTALAIPEAKLALLRHFLINGEAMMTINGALDINGCGRQLFPGSPLQKGRRVEELLRDMNDADAAHAGEYAAAETAGSQPVGGGPAANWNFFRSDTMEHRRPGFSASVKLCSNRVIGEELVNGENLSGRYLADGATFLYETGREYQDIFPVWDWRRVPGVTCVTSGTTLAPAGTMATSYAGGVSDGTYGAEGLDCHRDGVTARKGWFFLDRGVVCLGAGITGSNARTSLEQRLADGPVITSAGPLSPGVQACRGISWVLSGSEGYLFAQPTDVWAGNQSQAGSWRSVYSAGAAAQVTREVFSLWIDHAAQPGSYACTLLPGATPTELQADAASPPAEILSNTPALQAVRDTAAGVTEALFYQAGHLQAGTLSLIASGPCAVLARADGIRVADPTQKDAALVITVNGRPHSIPLPRGAQAGSTVRVE